MIKSAPKAAYLFFKILVTIFLPTIYGRWGIEPMQPSAGFAHGMDFYDLQVWDDVRVEMNEEQKFYQHRSDRINEVSYASNTAMLIRDCKTITFRSDKIIHWISEHRDFW
jgi:hypothetical protein